MPTLFNKSRRFPSWVGTGHETTNTPCGIELYGAVESSCHTALEHQTSHDPMFSPGFAAENRLDSAEAGSLSDRL